MFEVEHIEMLKLTFFSIRIPNFSSDVAKIQ